MKFKLHWRSGDVSEIEGKTIHEAMASAGYGNGSLRALDYWSMAEYPKDKENVEEEK
jgi:hypothetical protein